MKKSELADIAKRLDWIAEGLGREVGDNPHLQTLASECVLLSCRLNAIVAAWNSTNGKGTSEAKKAASRANAKRGGRPPKALTGAKRRLAALLDDQAHNRLVPIDDDGNSDIFAPAKREQDIADTRAKIAVLQQDYATKRAQRIAQLEASKGQGASVEVASGEVTGEGEHEGNIAL